MRKFPDKEKEYKVQREIKSMRKFTDLEARVQSAKRVAEQGRRSYYEELNIVYL